MKRILLLGVAASMLAAAASATTFEFTARSGSDTLIGSGQFDNAGGFITNPSGTISDDDVVSKIIGTNDFGGANNAIPLSFAGTSFATDSGNSYLIANFFPGIFAVATSHPGEVFDVSQHGLTAAVPEPATWALMLVGFGGLGAGMRRSRRNPATTYGSSAVT
jgi:hypothetical protein